MVFWVVAKVFLSLLGGLCCLGGGLGVLDGLLGSSKWLL